MGKSSKYLGVTLFKPTGKWRAQISMGGTTTSLGDHDTEEEAARAFDRAALNRSGAQAKTNFAVVDYATELELITSMDQNELVQMLRSRARKSGTHTSNYRGVSLLRHTHKWHAQININGKQVHLGFYESEEAAARAYDRAAINKGAKEQSRIVTNFDVEEYSHEIHILAAMEQSELVDILAVEQARSKFIPLLQQGNTESIGEMLSRPNFTVCTEDEVAKFKVAASRAVPKLQHLPRWRQVASGSLSSPAGNSARSTIINTARSVIVNDGNMQDTKMADCVTDNALLFKGQVSELQGAAGACSRPDDGRKCDSSFDRAQPGEADSHRFLPFSASALEMTPRDSTAHSSALEAGMNTAERLSLIQNAKRPHCTISESQVHKDVGMVAHHAEPEDFAQSPMVCTIPNFVKPQKSVSKLVSRSSSSSQSQRTLNRRTRRAPQRAAV